MSQPSYPSPQVDMRRGPQKKGISGLMIFLIIAGVLGLLFLAAVGGLIYFVSQLGSDSAEMRTVVANDSASQLEVPSNWTQITGDDSNVEATIQYGNMLGEKYVMVLSEPKSDLYEVFGDGFSLDDFAELIIGGMEEQNFQVGTSKPVTVNGVPGQRIRMTTQMDGMSIVYMVSLLEGNDNFHQVHAWTLTSREKKNMPILIKVSDSFREN